MPDSPLDEIIKQVQSNDIVENRLILFKRFLDAELFILIDDPQDPKPKLVNLREGQIFLGLINDKFSKPKHPIDLKDIPTFSDNWGLFSIN